MTWYPQSYLAKVPMTNMNMRPDVATGYPGRTYRFYTGETVYGFGDGLGYANVSHQLVKAPTQLSVPLAENHVCYTSLDCKSIEANLEETCNNLGFDIHLKVKNNNASIDGGHTVFLFSTPPDVHNAPQKHLLGFEKVFLRGGEERSVRFKVDFCKDLSVVDEVGSRKIALGEHVFHVGDLKHSLSVRI